MAKVRGHRVKGGQTAVVGGSSRPGNSWSWGEERALNQDSSGRAEAEAGSSEGSICIKMDSNGSSR